MSTLGTVTIQHPEMASVSGKLCVSYDADPKAYGGLYLKTATVTLDTGAATVQLYAEAITLREIAAVMLAAAQAVDAGVAAAAEVTAAEAA